MDHMTTAPDTQKLIKELKRTQIICMVLSFLSLCLLGGGILLFGKVQELTEICRPVAEKVSALDVESLNDTLAHINASLETVDWEQVADALGELDVEAINSAIEGLDTEELSESLKNLNDAVEKVQEISEKMSEGMSNVTSWVGGMFH
ncbi:MAG: hypothetical protein K2O97_14540 [Acetatifactor sp.]|nr:hypothetical protein [Acetatifactor sp.]MDE7046192.1 hypothetical protein [Acetatifactor sp.]